MFKSLLPWKHTKTKVMVPEQTMEDDNILQEQRLLPCNTCGRTFFPLPLKKHVPICEKNSVKKRKIFDSLKQRVEGTDLAQFHQKTYLKRQESIPKAVEPKPKKPSQWEENHKKLVDAIRSAKGASRDMSSSKKPQPVAASNERCPFCERQFGHKAFDRHVEWCKEHRTRIQKSPANVLLAKERLEARTKYKVPPLNKSKRTAVKEKYSNTNVVNRTESVCSVKSTPTNPPRRNPSIRKPRSVLDLGKKVDSPVKIEKATSLVSTDDAKKNKETNKSLRSKRYCPPREKVNSTNVNESVESITVAPIKFVALPNKKLVTWKELSGSVSENGQTDEESVIVVYENSNVFGKRNSSKNQTFIEELNEILADSDEDDPKKNYSSDTLNSSDKNSYISPKSKSSPEFRSREAQNLPSTPDVRFSRSEWGASTYQSTLELTKMSSEEMSSTLPLSVYTDDLIKSSNESFSKTSNTDEMCNSSWTDIGEGCKNTTMTRVKESTTSDEEITKLIRLHVDNDLSLSDLNDNCERTTVMDNDDGFTSDEENTDRKDYLFGFCKFSSKVESQQSEYKNGGKHSSERAFIESLKQALATSSKCDDSIDNKEFKHDSDFVEDDKDDSCDDSDNLSKNVEYSNSLFSLSSKLPSNDSILSLKSTEIARDVASGEQIRKKSLTQDANPSDQVSSLICNLNHFCFGKENDENFNIEYEVPKKRRKLNSTFVVDAPTWIKDKTVGCKDEEKVLQAVDGNKAKNTCLLPKILNQSHRVKKEERTKSPPTKLPLVESKLSENRNGVTALDARFKRKFDKQLKIKRDLSSVFLSYPSKISTPYDPFASAERQFMELLECDDFKPFATTKQPLTHTPRPYTAATNATKVVSQKPVKSAVAASKNRTSIIDPPTSFQDSELVEDDFEILENLINKQFNDNGDFFLSLNKDSKDGFNLILNERKYSDDMSSIDSSLINETDNLSIPEHFKLDHYSPTSTEDTDTTIQNDSVDLYSLEYDKKIETQLNTKGKVKKCNKTKSKSGSSFEKKTSKVKNNAKNALFEPILKAEAEDCSKSRAKGNAKKGSESGDELDLTIKPEDLFAVDDKMYAEYKIYEEMYLKEKDHLANSRKQKAKNCVKSYGIDLNDDNSSPPKKVSDDSAYGSLNRNTPKPKTAKLSPLQRKRIDSASSSGSENCAILPDLGNQQRMSKFCHECGNKYPLTTAKFCVECGVRRLVL